MTAISYEQFDYLSNVPENLKLLYRRMKTLAQLQVVLGLGCIALGSLYFVNRGGLASMTAGVICGLYFMLTGMLGVCGSAAERRRLVIVFLVLCLHAALLFCPLLILSSSFDGLLENPNCKFNCSTTPHFNCEVRCEQYATWSWMANESSRLTDVLLMSVAVIEFIVCSIICYLYHRSEAIVFELTLETGQSPRGSGAMNPLISKDSVSLAVVTNEYTPAP